MAELKPGIRLNLTDNYESIEVIRKIGEGGQGFVYEVKYKDKILALKWYKKGVIQNPEVFRKNLMNNIRFGAPTSQFLWPVALTEEYEGSFGYIMMLRPPNYYEFSEFLMGKKEFHSVELMLKAAIQIVSSFRMLHNQGFSYQDLNDGNFFMNPETGDILICDNDNVSKWGEQSGIAGKCRYMAPAVVMGRKLPDKKTDEFSLAVILFLLLMRNHPLEGIATQQFPIMTEQLQKYYYGENPVFIADPQNTSNRPVEGVHNNFILRWPMMPNYVQDAFVKAFSHEVMCEDKQGMTEKEWISVLLRFRSEIIICPYCHKETRYIAERTPCICCRHELPHHSWIKTPYYCIPVFPQKEILEAYLTDTYDQNECMNLIASVSMTKDGTKMTLRNEEAIPWHIENVEVPPQKRMMLLPGQVLYLKNERIEII